MTASFVTQCPHCQTSFRVSRAQLGAAHGAVRCGACLHVFNATQHLLGEQAAAPKPAAAPVPPPRPSAPSTPAAAAKTAPPGKTPSDTLWIHDDLDLDSLDLDEELAKLEREELQLSQEFLALKRGAEAAESLPKPREEARNQHDEQWAEALLNEERPARPAPPPAPRAPAPAQAATPAAQPPAPAPLEPTPSEPLPAPDSLGAADELNNDFRLSAERDDPDTDESAEAEPASPAAEVESAKRRHKADRNEPALHDEGLLSLSEEPLQLDWRQPRKPWGRWLAWGLLNLLGAAALTGQYIWYHFDELARQDQYRPWFEQLCPEIGCRLPSKVEIALIKSSNLVVRSHPEFSGALVVDAILYNRAPFAQPFPLLELRFADLNGQLLASRRFKPGEYLSGELAGQPEMPPQTPIHISLDILDPGTKAVNYSLSFHSPE